MRKVSAVHYTLAGRALMPLCCSCCTHCVHAHVHACMYAHACARTCASEPGPRGAVNGALTAFAGLVIVRLACASRRVCARVTCARAPELNLRLAWLACKVPPQVPREGSLLPHTLPFLRLVLRRPRALHPRLQHVALPPPARLRQAVVQADAAGAGQLHCPSDQMQACPFLRPPPSIDWCLQMQACPFLPPPLD